MAAVAHDPAFAAMVKVPQAVGMEFNQADKGGTLLALANRIKVRRTP